MKIEELRKRWPAVEIEAVNKHVGGGYDSWVVSAVLGPHTRVFAQQHQSNSTVWRHKGAACNALDLELKWIRLTVREGG